MAFGSKRSATLLLTFAVSHSGKRRQPTAQIAVMGQDYRNGLNRYHWHIISVGTFLHTSKKELVWWGFLMR